MGLCPFLISARRPITAQPRSLSTTLLAGCPSDPKKPKAPPAAFSPRMPPTAKFAEPAIDISEPAYVPNYEAATQVAAAVSEAEAILGRCMSYAIQQAITGAAFPSVFAADAPWCCWHRVLTGSVSTRVEASLYLEPLLRVFIKSLY